MGRRTLLILLVFVNLGNHNIVEVGGSEVMMLVERYALIVRQQFPSRRNEIIIFVVHISQFNVIKTLS